jgi:dihydrofolate synthase/folylpolyglutamate synthase
VRIETGGNAAVAAAAVSELLGREVAPRPLFVAGRFDVRSERPFEVWDGAHNPAGMRYLVEQLPDRRFVVVASILGDKGVDEMLATLAPHVDHLVATQSHNPRALTAEALAEHARRYVANVHLVRNPIAAVETARALAADDGAVLVTGSLYLLAELAGDAS